MAKRFKWRFESVKNAKDREEERNQEALAEARRLLHSEEAELSRLLDLRNAYLGQLREKQAGRLNTADISLVHAYLEKLGGQIQEQTQRVDKARSGADEKRTILLKTVQERKVLENLKDRDHREFRKEERRRDQATMDETANRRAFDNGRTSV